jgi:hypothetical protein
LRQGAEQTEFKGNFLWTPEHLLVGNLI